MDIYGKPSFFHRFSSIFSVSSRFSWPKACSTASILDEFLRSELSLESLGPAQLRQIRATALERLEVYYQALTRGYRQGGERYVLDICRRP